MISKPLVLICDDDSEILQSLHLSLRSSFDIHTANSVSKAKLLTEKNSYDAAIVDLNFEGQELDGIDLLDFLGKASPGTFVVVLSGDSSVKRVVEAMRRKLFAFIHKDGEHFDKLVSALTRATQLKIASREKSAQQYLTQSPLVKELLKKAEMIFRSNSESPILIMGETGSGKEFLAQHIAHNLRSKLVAVNMGSIPKDMAESILFGHEKGSFTGAIANKIGLFESANGGTLFLDEIGESSAAIQAKLLRVLQEKEIQPLGSNRTRKVDVRIIAATHRELESMVSEGTFRLDLLQRLNTFILRLPPLRERPEDVVFYTNLFLSELNEEGIKFNLTEDGISELLAYRWPGNIRELKSVIERIVVLSNKININKEVVAEAINLGKSHSTKEIKKIEVISNNAKREELIKALAEFSNNKRLAARSLGISEATIYRWIENFGLKANSPEVSGVMG